MTEQTSTTQPAPKPIDKKTIAHLSQPGNLAAFLRELDGAEKKNRIFLMGCGRSGTWLLTALMCTYRNMAVVAKELPVEYFSAAPTRAPNVLMKRAWHSYRQIENIPEEIGILYIIRHPYDVLTSNNAMTKERFHVPPFRWLGEMLSLQFLVDTKRPRVKIVRYEELVTDSKKVQDDIGAFFGLQSNLPPGVIPDTFKDREEIVKAMHGLRPITPDSIGRYKKDPENLIYLRHLRPRLGRTLDWVAETFGYDIELS